jgi:hypothetical protein
MASVVGVGANSAVVMERPALAAVTEAMAGTGHRLAVVSSGAVLEVASQRPVLSPKFEPRAESALAGTLRDVAANLPGGRAGVVAVEEFRGPWGVPDLAVLTPKRTELRLACGIPPLLSQHDCRLVTAATRWTEPAELAAIARVALAPAARHVRRLVSAGALDMRGGRLRRSSGMIPLGRLWAVEAKVDDWQTGLAQVHRYRLWADGAVLVLGRARVPTEEIAMRARHYQVGLVIDGRWILRPPMLPPSAATRLRASEHMLAALIGTAP